MLYMFYWSFYYFLIFSALPSILLGPFSLLCLFFFAISSLFIINDSFPTPGIVRISAGLPQLITEYEQHANRALCNESLCAR